MLDEAAFVEEIRKYPTDTTPRLIYADYLEDVGNPRGEFIRVQCEIAESEPGDDSRSILFKREQDLLDQFGDQWLKPVRDLGAEGVSRSSFQRGLIERIKIKANQLLEVGDKLFDLSPALECLVLRDPQPVIDELASYTIPQQITSIDLSANQLQADTLSVLSGATWSGQMKSLDLQMNQLVDMGVVSLTAGTWDSLEELNLGMNRIGPDGIRHLVNWQRFSRLKSLDLRMNRFGNPGMTLLCNASAPSLEYLNLTTCQITTIESLKSADWPVLHELSIRNNRIHANEFTALAESEIGKRLENIDTRNNNNTLS